MIRSLILSDLGHAFLSAGPLRFAHCCASLVAAGKACPAAWLATRTSGSLARVWPVTPKPETFYVNVVDDMPKPWLGKTAEQAGWN